MNKVYFKIDNHALYLDYMLEEYDYVPILYVCKDEEQERYLVLATDFEKESYLISKITLLDLNNMLLGKLDIRSAFLNQPKFWSVHCNGTDYQDDMVNEYETSSYPKEYLPAKDEFYVLYDEEHKEYQRRIAKELKDTIDKIAVKKVELQFGENMNFESATTEFFDWSQEVDIENNESQLTFVNDEIGLYAA